MDQKEYDARKSLHRENTSMGLLNMDNLKVLGEMSCDYSYKNSISNGENETRRKVNDRLNAERAKALEALKKSNRDEFFKKPLSSNSQENSKGSTNLSKNNPLSQLDHTDYVPYRRHNAINISDLVTDETMHLECSSPCSTSASKDNIKVSFEPSEITGRSTQYNKDMKNYKNVAVESNSKIPHTLQKTRMSVSDILASSFAPKARNLCETLSADITMESNERQTAAITSLSSSFSGLNSCRSLPRTADMSLSNNSCTDESLHSGFGSFPFSSAAAGTSMDVSEVFSPGELMKTQLINDEISWAQEYAAIPTATLSKEALAKAASNSGAISNGFEMPSSSNSMIAGDPNFSVGTFFNMRSDNIWSIVESISPDKCRTPFPLVDEDDTTVTTTSDMEGSKKISLTPRIDNKTYTRLGHLSTILDTKKSMAEPSPNLNHGTKNSETSTDNSYLLSISAIDRALCNLDIQSNTSGMGVPEQLLLKGKKSQKNSRDDIRATVGKADIPNAIEEILENKENVDPCQKRSSGSSAARDTMSFTESLFNSSDMKSFMQSFTKPRSPLSPIDVTPHIAITEVADEGAEADNDEWPGTPINSDRRIRRKKSPRDKSPFKLNGKKNDSTHAVTPVNSKPSRAYALKNPNRTDKEPNSLSSTRIDGATNDTNGNRDFGISPNISHTSNYASSLVVRTDAVNNPQMSSSNTASPSQFDISSTNSPSSPMPTNMGLPSPNLDATPTSDRPLFHAEGAKKAVSSPVGSESSSTCSYGAYRNGMSAACGRSVSRCSTTSEFSHRDGKQIPLKITNMELSWGSIKLRSDSRKSMQIKNITNKRLVMRIEVSGPGFQIVNSQRSNTITLHSQECRTISISFCPTVRGVAIGKLSFHAPSGTTELSNSFLDVPLFAYGGNASIIAQNIFTGPVGAPFVTMGDICELAQPLERSISFYNKGPLLGFASVTVDSIGLMIPRLSDAFEIHPHKVLIPPKSMVNVHIVFRPKREEIRKIVKKSGSVLTLANLRVICGDEANRQRIRRLLPLMSEKERSKLLSSSLDMVWSDFPQEMEMADLNDMKENPSAAFDLLLLFRIHEILLTINHDNIDDTFDSSSMFLADADETVLFRTVCPAADSPTTSSNLGTVDEEEESNAEPGTKAAKPNSWSVRPQAVEINVNKPMPVYLRVFNGFKSRQFFEVVCNLKKLLHFQPSDGYVLPDGGETEISISLEDNYISPTESVFIMVYMENERIMVPVHLIK